MPPAATTEQAGTAGTTTQTTEAAVLAASATSGTGGSAGSTENPSGTAASAASPTDAQKPANSSGDAGSQQPNAAAVVPESYTLRLPDGSTLGADFVTRTADIARALGLSNEAGQQLLDAQIAEVTKASTSSAEQAKADAIKAMQPGGAVWTEQTGKWHDAALADTELGGSPEKLKATTDLALKVMHQFATDDTKKFLNDSGLGNHPELLRVFARIGKSMSESSFKLAGPGDAAPKTQEERLARRYPTMVAKS